MPVHVFIAVLLLLGFISGIIGAFFPQGSTKGRAFTLTGVTAMLVAVAAAALT